TMKGRNKTMENLLDVTMGLQYCADSEEIYREILQMFCDSMLETKAEILSAKATENWLDYATHVHALKSTSLTIGSVPLSEAAKELELAAKDGSPESLALVEQKTVPLMELYDETVQAIIEWLG
ncbi:MAG: Hpt domain-containing protein, partial [Eubacterium sp.]|nr:Hpt domain-containing protein [Eubacterium sp.]